MAPLIHKRAVRTYIGTLGVLVCFSLATRAQEKQTPTPLHVAVDGTVSVPSQNVPLSSLLSPEAKAYVTQHLKDMQDPAALAQENGVPRFMQPYLTQMKAMYPVPMQDTKIGSVHVYDFHGEAGDSTKRVLINLHGGGFSGCWPGCALLESIPIAAVGKIRVVSVDYREGPDNKFPAASEDVEKVYRALLQQYRPQSIGIYGCSAGGALTAMSLAWFQKHDLPMPGAVGIFCAGAGGFGTGDATYTALPLGEARMPSPKGNSLPPLQYFSGTDPDDPLIAPVKHPDVLAKFPPTLLITGTRDFALSNTLNTNIELAKAGVESRLYVWDGLFHGFFYNPSVPESQDAYRIIVQFFSAHMG